jgi:hypothetical protein
VQSREAPIRAKTTALMTMICPPPADHKTTAIMIAVEVMRSLYL